MESTLKIINVVGARPNLMKIGPEDCEPAIILRKKKGGITVRPGDAHGVADALRKLTQNPQFRISMGKCARKYYENNFGRNQGVSRICKIIESIWELLMFE